MVLMNNEIKAYIQIGEENGSAVWGDLGRAFKSVSQSLGESKYSAAYLADGGFTSSEVTGLSFQLTLTGDYMKNDPVIKYLFSKEVIYGVGEGRKTKLKLVRDNTQIVWSVTMTKIAEDGGDANEPDEVTLELSGNGKPEVTLLEEE